MQEQHYDSVVGLMHILHDDMTLQELEEELPVLVALGFEFWVALHQGSVVGYVYGSIRTDYVEGSVQLIDRKVGYIESLCVLPTYRKRGIARALCQHLQEHYKAKGCRELASDAYASNTASIEFHKSIGFEVSEPAVHFIKSII
jgi:aminoglycoside 6'-N-acetyltransferase I